jgi:hypothetical protein
MRSPFIVAAAIAAVPSVALAQASPAPPAAPPPASAHWNAPGANATWNADRFHFDYGGDSGCHFVYDYNFKNGDMHLDRRGDCSDFKLPHP